MQQFRLRIAAALFLLTCQPGFALAEAEQEFFSDVPVVLSVSRLAQPLAEAPGAITVIDREMIRASGFREIADLFRLVPGFVVSSFDGARPIVAYHGLNDEFARRLQVLVDGRSMYTPLFGGMEWSDLPLAIEDIERIEVIRGPNAASYGANSFLGIINIITRHASQDQGVYAGVTTGSDGIGDAVARFGGRSGDLDYRLTVRSQGDEGFPDVNDGKRAGMLTGRADYRIGSLDTLQMQFGYLRGRQGAGEPQRPVDPPHTKFIESTFEQVRWQHTADAENEISVQFYHTYHDASESVITAPLPAFANLRAAVSNDAAAERYDLEFQQISGLRPGLRGVWGFGARRDKVSSPLYFFTSRSEEDHESRLFGHLEWRATPDLLLSGGTMWESNSTAPSRFSPRLAANYAIAPGQTLRASLSTAHRLPTLFEARADYRIVARLITPLRVPLVVAPQARGNPNLQPERILSREVGYVADFPRHGIQFDAKVYRDSLQDINQGLRSPDIVDARMFGAEGQMRFRPDQDTLLLLGYAYTRVTTSTLGDLADDIPAAAPRHSLQLLAQRRFASLTASVGYYFVSAMDGLGSGDPQPRYDRLDLRLARPFRFGEAKGELALVLQNLLGDYQDFRQENVMKRRSYFSMSLDY